MARRPAILFPERLTFPRLLAATAGWLGAILLLASVAGLLGALVVYRGATDHGASALALGGIVVAAVLLGAAVAVVRLERSGGTFMRLLGATALAGAAVVCSFYPWSAIRDPGSFPVTGAVVFGLLAVLAAGAAWSLARRR